MPIFASGFGHHSASSVYGVLLFANGVGGITVGLIGGLIGVHASLAISSLLLCVTTFAVVGYARTTLTRPAGRVEYESV